MKTEQKKEITSEEFLSKERGKSNAISTHSIESPKGGEAIKGIDEKFSINAVNGIAGFSLPLRFSPARGSSPALNLTYNSGAGNGVFGLGWNLSLASIKRKTGKKQPQYLDHIDSDIFLFSEAEDLVYKFAKNRDGGFHKKEVPSPDDQYLIRYYRPLIEGLFARIERWQHKNSHTLKWKVVTKDNVTTLFGWSHNSIINHSEDGKGLDTNLLHRNNRIKAGKISYTNFYHEKVLYVNKTPYKKFNGGCKNFRVNRR